MSLSRRLFFVLIALSGVAAVALQRDPIEIDAHELEQSPVVPAAREDATALLLIDDLVVTEAAHKRQWSEFDASYAWLSDLEEEVGRTSVVMREDFEQRLNASVNLIVISRSARALPADQASSLLEWVVDGGVVVLEQPAADLQSALGVEMSAPMPVTALDSVRVSTRLWPVADHPALPVHTTRMGLGYSEEAWEPLLWMDGHEAAWVHTHGQGAVLLLGVDLSRWLTALRQGVPREDMTVERTRGSQGREQFYQPNDFMADRDREFAWVPRADLLLRALLDPARRLAAHPRIGALPPGARGIFLMTHDEDNFGDRSQFMSDESERHEAGSTMFVVGPRISTAGAKGMLDAGADVQLHWNRGFWERRIRRMGVGPFQPLMREMTLIEQRDDVAARLPEGSPAVTMNRNHGLMWDDSWTRTFRILAAGEFEFDSTYGPDENLFGWVFDTARPYHPLDENGRAFDLIELPFPYQDDEQFERHWQRRLLEESSEAHHGVLAAIFHSVTMTWNPSASRMRGWLESYDLAESLDHPVWSVSQYMEFREARLESRLSRATSQPDHNSYFVDVRAPELVVEWMGDYRAFVDEQEQLDVAPTVNGWQGITLSRGGHQLRLEPIR